LVDAAAEAGADAIKFQTFRAEALAAPTAAKAPYQAATTGEDESQLAMLRRLELPAEAFSALRDHCRERDILFLSTPFDEVSADLLADLSVPAFKIGSGELTNLPFLRYVASKGLPVILSTGMAVLAEVASAVDVLRQEGAPPLVLLHCVSAYPADPVDANLRAMATMTAAFGVPVGFSDHTPGQAVALAAVALGARVLEKHLTLDRDQPGPDHRTSLDAEDFARLVGDIREVESALGDGRKVPAASEREIARVVRRSIVAIRDIGAGAVLGPDDISIQRPGTGMPPARLNAVIGRQTRLPIAAGTPLEPHMLT